MKNILWMAAGMAIVGMLTAFNGFFRVQQVEAVPGAEIKEWSTLFTNAAKLADEKAFDRFITEFKTRIAKEEKTVQEQIISILSPIGADEDRPELLLTYFKNACRAVQDAEVEGIGSISEGFQAGVLNAVAELYMWKMVVCKLKKATGGERVILLDDQKRWMAWRKEHSQLIYEAAGGGSGQTWFENLALSELGYDRLNELFCFENSCTEVYRDLKFASVKCKGKSIPLKHGRLYFEQEGKKVVGRIINPAFCRRVVLGGDIYKFAVLEPDYIIDEGHNCDGFSWVCVWRNGKNTANYRLPIEKKVRHRPLFSEERKIESGIKLLSVSNTVVSIIPSITGTPVAIDIKAANRECID
ncbi:MAG: hypothetical protein WCJ02_09695 [bacterium]